MLILYLYSTHVTHTLRSQTLGGLLAGKAQASSFTTLLILYSYSTHALLYFTHTLRTLFMLYARCSYVTHFTLLLLYSYFTHTLLILSRTAANRAYGWTTLTLLLLDSYFTHTSLIQGIWMNPYERGGKVQVCCNSCNRHRLLFNGALIAPW